MGIQAGKSGRATPLRTSQKAYLVPHFPFAFDPWKRRLFHTKEKRIDRVRERQKTERERERERESAHNKEAISIIENIKSARETDRGTQTKKRHRWDGGGGGIISGGETRQAVFC